MHAWVARSKPAVAAAFQLEDTVKRAAPDSAKVESQGSDKLVVTATNFTATVISPAEAETCPEEVGDATGIIMDEVDDIDEVTPEVLPGGEGYILTAAGDGTFFVRARRNLGGTTIALRSDTRSEDGMLAAADFCRSLRV